MKKYTVLIYLSLILLLQTSNIYAQKSENKTDMCIENQQDGHPVDILTGAYDGRYWIQQTEPLSKKYECAGNATLNLKAGKYNLVIGGYTGGSYYRLSTNIIFFEITTDGKIVGVSNKLAINTETEKTLKFNNVEIDINPQNYSGSYYPGQYAASVKLPCNCKSCPFTVVPNLDYYIRLYNIDNDEILFHVDDAGKGFGEVTVINNPRAAIGEGKTLKFFNEKIKINSDYKGNIVFGGTKIRLPAEPIIIVPYTAIPISFPGIYGKILIRTRYFIVPEDLFLIKKSKSETCVWFNFKLVD